MRAAVSRTSIVARSVRHDSAQTFARVQCVNGIHRALDPFEAVGDVPEKHGVWCQCG
jgi:hypothetical protein